MHLDLLRFFVVINIKLEFFYAIFVNKLCINCFFYGDATIATLKQAIIVRFKLSLSFYHTKFCENAEVSMQKPFNHFDWRIFRQISVLRQSFSKSQIFLSNS